MYDRIFGVQALNEVVNIQTPGTKSYKVESQNKTIYEGERRKSYNEYCWPLNLIVKSGLCTNFLIIIICVEVSHAFDLVVNSHLNVPSI